MKQSIIYEAVAKLLLQNKFRNYLYNLFISCVSLIGFFSSPLNAHSASTAAARKTIEKKYDIYLEAEFLYWKPKTNGLRYGSKGFADSSTPKMTEYQKTIRFNPEFDSGVRAKLGYDVSEDPWRLSLEWTYYHNSTQHERSLGNAAIFYPYFANKTNAITSGPGAQASWSLNLNYADLMMSHPFKLGSSFTLMPSIGTRGAWMDQSFNIKYLINDPNDGLNFINSINDIAYYGYGLRAGLATLWDLGYGFGIYGNTAFSALWSHFNIVQRELLNATSQLRSKAILHENMVTPIIELQLGLCWRKEFSKKRYFIDFHAGWEEQIWFNQINWGIPSKAFDPYDTIWLEEKSFNLGLSGFTAGATFGF